MYLYQSATRLSNLPPCPIIKPRNDLDRIISRELTTSTLAKEQFKDSTSSKLGVKGDREADALTHKELLILRR